MRCPQCSGELVTFTVPVAVRDIASAPTLSICPRCFELVERSGGREEFDRVHESIPVGDSGAMMLLALGLLSDSVALHYHDIGVLFDRVSDAGTDPWIILEHLEASRDSAQEVDLRRVRYQLEQLL